MDNLMPYVKDLGQVIVVLGMIWGIMKVHGDKIDKLMEDTAVLKDRALNTKDDHDRIVMTEASAKRAHERLDEMRVSKR
jgi:hypothetical protein